MGPRIRPGVEKRDQDVAVVTSSSEHEYRHTILVTRVGISTVIKESAHDADAFSSAEPDFLEAKQRGEHQGGPPAGASGVHASPGLE